MKHSPEENNNAGSGVAQAESNFYVPYESPLASSQLDFSEVNNQIFQKKRNKTTSRWKTYVTSPFLYVPLSLLIIVNIGTYYKY